MTETPEGGDQAAQNASEGALKDDEPRLRNPFRSEADAFRLLVILIAAIALMVAAAKLGGAAVGLPVAAVVFGIGFVATYRWLKVAIQEREADADPGL